MDRGIATEENVALLREKQVPYCVVERRAAEKDYADLFATAHKTFSWFAPDPSSPDEGVFLRKQTPKDGTVDLLVLSATRTAKEESMDNSRETRFQEELEALRIRIGKGGAGAKMDPVASGTLSIGRGQFREQLPRDA